MSTQQLFQQAQSCERAGNLAQAAALYRQIVAAAPDDHPSWHALGLLAFNQGNLPFAVQCIETAIACDGKLALYHRNIGEMYRRMGQLEKSALAGRHATQLAPDDLDAHYNLGLAYADAKDYPKAIAAYRKALKLDARHGLSWNNLGSALEQQGDKPEALRAYEKAMAIDPQHAEAQNNAGAIYSEQGKLEEARACFASAIAAQPDFVEAHYNLSSLKKYAADDPHLAMLESAYARRESLVQQTRIRCGFALGKALDDIGEYDRAFAAYEEGNRLQHALLPMDEARADALLARIVEVFDAQFFTARRNWHCAVNPARTPIFIVGMPRSGTTLLEQILCSHAAVHGAGELVELNKAVCATTGATADKAFTERSAVLAEADMKHLGDDYLRRVWKLSPDSRYITDKMPGNFFYLGLIHLALPHAKIIHALRDPMDSCFSCYSRLFNDTMEFAYDQGTLGRYYARYMTLMRHWHKVLPPDTILDLRYEDMVADTEAQAMRVLKFVGLPWDANCLKFYENKRLVKTASVAQVRKPIYKSSVARWKHFARHLRPLYQLVRDYRPADDADMLTAQAIPVKVGAGGTAQSAGRIAETEGVLRQILQIQPQQAHTLHLLGVAAHQAGKLDLAISLIGQAVAIDDRVALYHSNLAEMNRQQGMLEAAILHGEQAVALDASMASAHSNLGIAYFEAKDYDRAEMCHQKALARVPELVQSLNNLGSIARARKNLKGAAEWYRKALAINPDYLDSLSNLGAVLMEDDQPDAAEPLLVCALQQRQNYPEGLCNLGLVRLKQERTEEARALFHRSLAQRPDYTEALIGLALVCHQAGKLEEARRLSKRATEVAPDNADAWCQFGTLSMENGDTADAEAAYGKALALDPGMANALAGLGNLRLEEGKIDTSISLLEQAIALAPDNVGARFHLTQARKTKPDDSNLAALETMQSDNAAGFDATKRICLHYALGKAYDDLQDYGRAFPHFMAGARLKRAKLNYDPAAGAARMQRIAEVVDHTFIERLQGAGASSALPVFVLGMPRSGTTLTEQIIASHPEVHGAGELHDLMDIVQQQTVISPQPFLYPENLPALTLKHAASWGRTYVERLHRRAPEARRITDKMPANYMALGLIHLLLPNAKIVHVKRDPVDTCVSCFTRLFNQHQEATYDLTELGRHYANYERLMQHWRTVLPPGSFMEVHYEDIVADTETQARRLIDWCDLDWNDACLAFHKNKRNIRTASVTQVRRPIYTSSIARWRHYEKFLAPLLDGLGEFAPKP